METDEERNEKESVSREGKRRGEEIMISRFQGLQEKVGRADVSDEER